MTTPDPTVGRVPQVFVQDVRMTTQSAVDRVPTEVWEEIFLFTVADAEEDAFDIAQTNDGPVGIVESWRTHHLLNIAIPRSTIHPLDFSIVIVDNDAAQVVLPHLVEVMDHWRDISIEASPLAFQFFAAYVRLSLDLIGNGASKVMGRLEAIEFTTFPIAYPAWHWNSQNIFESALSLRSVYMEGIWVRRMPWGTLTDMCIDGKIGSVDAMDILRASFMLHELKISKGITHPVGSAPPGVVVHHTLQILRVHDPSILEFLRAPVIDRAGNHGLHALGFRSR
ncbi:hypothetical protein EDD85DRAFT_962388 [Armillaria nabsnona]|nr:hypothetical protein EDD85DRAFT_962388 [Armillaria nabsnona]